MINHSEGWKNFEANGFKELEDELGKYTAVKYEFSQMTKKFGYYYVETLAWSWCALYGCRTLDWFLKYWGNVPKSFFERTILPRAMEGGLDWGFDEDGEPFTWEKVGTV